MNFSSNFLCIEPHLTNLLEHNDLMMADRGGREQSHHQHHHDHDCIDMSVDNALNDLCMDQILGADHAKHQSFKQIHTFDLKNSGMNVDLNMISINPCQRTPSMHATSLVSNQTLMNLPNKKYDAHSIGHHTERDGTDNMTNSQTLMNISIFNNFESMAGSRNFTQQTQKNPYNINSFTQQALPSSHAWTANNCGKDKSAQVKLNEDLLKTNSSLSTASVDNSNTTNLFELNSMTKNFLINNAGTNSVQIQFGILKSKAPSR